MQSAIKQAKIARARAARAVTDSPHAAVAQRSAMSLPENLVTPCQTTYRSVGLGVYAVVVGTAMPLEKVAMIANSSLVSSGKESARPGLENSDEEGAPRAVSDRGPGLDHGLVFTV